MIIAACHRYLVPLLVMIFWIVPLCAEPRTLKDPSGVYERVIINDTMPGYAAHGGKGGVTGKVLALRPYYVFDGDDTWIRVGRTTRDENLFWVTKAGTTPWKHNIVLTFTTRGLLNRTLFLDTYDALDTLLNDENPKATAAELRERAVEAERLVLAGGTADAAPVVALGPKEGIDSKKNFYYLPILNFEPEVYFQDGTEALALEASILKKRAAGEASSSVPTEATTYRSGVAFVIDTTKSMSDYLDETRRQVKSIIERIENGPVADRISFSLVGYRDSITAKPSIKYLTKTFLPFSDRVNSRAFGEAMDQMVESEVSTHQTREDAFAGIMHAANDLDWKPFAGRWIVLVTDASARNADDPYSQTKRNAAGLASYLRTNLNAGLIALHINTKEGKNDHERARAQYETLSMPGNDGALYRAISAEAPAEFVPSYGRAAKFVTTLLLNDTVRFNPTRGATSLRLPPTDDPELKQLGERIGRLAQAFRLNYLGKIKRTDAPDLLSGWAIDRDIDEPSKKPFDIRLLVTRNELASLEKAVSDAILLEQEGDLDGVGLFDAISGAAAKMTRQPDDVATAVEGSDRVGGISGVRDLENLIETLPYKSQSMEIRNLGWNSFGITKQQKFITSLYEKQAAYRAHYDDADAWVRLHPEDQDGDMVFPIPLDDLP